MRRHEGDSVRAADRDGGLVRGRHMLDSGGKTRTGETLKKAASGMKRKTHGAQRPRKRAKRVSAKANLQVMPELHIKPIGEGAKTKFWRRLTSLRPM